MTDKRIDQIEQISARVEKLLGEMDRLRATNKTLREQIKSLEAQQRKLQPGTEKASARQDRSRTDVHQRLEVLIERLETAEAELV